MAITGVITTHTVTIPNGEAVSGAIEVGGNPVVGILMPDTWTAASLSFKASIDGTNYFPLNDDAGSEYTATVAVDTYHVIDMSNTLGAKYIKLVSGTNATPVNQGAERSIEVVALRYNHIR